MKHRDDTLRMDPLLMCRLEIANVPLIARDDLSVSQTLAAAKKLDAEIQKQFPNSETTDRVKISRNLAKQLKDPNPLRVEAIMHFFYNHKLRPNSSSSGADGMGERGISRPKKRSDQVR